MATATNKPRRRWFRFSLRTLFVLMTLLCVWLGWNVYQVRQREAVLQYLQQHQIYMEATNPYLVHPWRRSLPFMWSWLGAKPVGYIMLPVSLYSDGDCRTVQQLFPEATVVGPRL